MPDEPTNRELKIMFDLSEKRSDEKHQELLGILSHVQETGSATLLQARTTNGRVNKHDWYFKAMWWALGAAWIVLLVGLPLLYQIFIYTLNVRISEAVESATTKSKQ